MHYAHSTQLADRSNWQHLADHLRRVAGLAGERGDKFGAGKAAALAGWLHDLGKYSDAFQAHIKGRPGHVDHSTAGAQEVLKLASNPTDKHMAELLAYAIAGHHAGVPDKTSRTGETSALVDRLKKPVEPVGDAWRTEIETDATGLAPKGFKPHSNRELRDFQISFLGRMIFSCLVDADFLDTEAFYASVDGRQVDRQWPVLAEETDRLIAAFDAQMARVQCDAAETPLNRLRSEILSHVRGKAALPRGVFTLNVPTGDGELAGADSDHHQRAIVRKPVRQPHLTLPQGAQPRQCRHHPRRSADHSASCAEALRRRAGRAGAQLWLHGRAVHGDPAGAKDAEIRGRI